MKMALADPPYLGRPSRWYGKGGRGSGAGLHRANGHESAQVWDDPVTHIDLLAHLQCSFDAWAVPAAPSSLPLYVGVGPHVRVLIWCRRNAVPSGARSRSCWEPVLISTPRRAYGSGLPINDVLDRPAPGGGFAGAKPRQWTRWVLDALGFVDGVDSVADLFEGTGGVASETDQGVLQFDLPGGKQ